MISFSASAAKTSTGSRTVSLGKKTASSDTSDSEDEDVSDTDDFYEDIVRVFFYMPWLFAFEVVL